MNNKLKKGSIDMLQNQNDDINWFVKPKLKKTNQLNRALSALPLWRASRLCVAPRLVTKLSILCDGEGNKLSDKTALQWQII